METPLTTSQEMLWMGQQLDPGQPLYNMAFAWFLHGAVDPAAFQRAFVQLLQQTDALRLRFATRGATAWQWDSQDSDDQLEFVDFSSAVDPQAEFHQWAQTRVQRSFDLAQQVYDSALIKLQSDEYVWYLNQHHLITDAVSCELLFQNLSRLYLQQLDSQSAATSAVAEQAQPPSFVDHARREQTILQQPASQQAVQYWLAKADKLTGNLAFYGRDAARRTVRARRTLLSLTAEQSARLKQLAAQPDMRALTEHLSVFNMFAALLTALLARVTGEATQQIGMLMHNRATPRARATVGVFIETCPLTLRIDERDSLLSLVGKVKAAIQAGLRHVKPGVSRATVERPVAVVFNYLPIQFASFAGIPVNANWIHPNAADPAHKLRLQVHDFDDTGRYQLLFELNEAVFDAADSNRIICHFGRLLDGCLQNPQENIADIDLLGKNERQQHLREFNTTALDFAEPCTVLARFEQHAASTPDALAVRVADAPQTQLTYAALNARANQLAELLRSSGVSRASLVPVLMRRSADMLVALLAVHKAGAAYLPLEPEHPAERNAAILTELAADQETRLGPLLSHRCHLPELAQCPCDVIIMDDALPALAGETGASAVIRRADDLAYVIYTSGSTGKPKGALITDRNLSNYVNWASRYYLQDRPGDLPLFTSLAFDLTVTSIYLPLVTGGCVHIYHSPEGGGLLELPRILADDAVDLIKLTPSHLALLQNEPIATSRLRGLILGGEILTTEMADWAWQSWQRRVAVFNEYGPTEATVGCMIHRFDARRDRRRSVSIGTPIANTQIYLLDDSQRPVPAGVVGELCIGGRGVAAGYLQRAELTRERFVNNPFGEGRLYRSGDLARWLDDGSVEFLGRSDRQVKLHGARIELDEIAATLQQHRSVKACAVELRHKSRPCPSRSPDSRAHHKPERDCDSIMSLAAAGQEGALLVAYYVADEPVMPDELRAYLAKHLPAFMLPSQFVALQSLPVTVNGKIDYAALPEPELIKHSYAPPHNASETILSGIWSQAFGIPQIGIHDNFFELGGDSVLAIQIVAAAHAAGLQLQPRQLFAQPTIARLAESLATAAQDIAEPASGKFPLPAVNKRDMQQLSSILGAMDEEPPSDAD